MNRADQSATAVALFSRDLRTHGLFRGAWMRAVETKGLTLEVYTRGQGAGAAVRHAANFVNSRHARRLIFGTAEIALLSPLARRSDVFVFTGMGRLLQREDARARRMLCFLKLMDRGQQVVVLNHDDHRLLHPIYGDRIVVLPGEGYRFDHTLAHHDHSGPLRFAYAGRLLRSKGVDILIDTCCRLGVDLLLMGDVDFNNSDAVDSTWLAQQLSDSGGRIRHVGFVNDVRMRLTNTDVYVSLSEREGLPFGVLDGINAGCALLLSDVAGHREFIDLPGVTLIAPEPERLEAVISAMVAHPENHITFDHHARLRAAEIKYGFEAIVSRIRDILSGAIA